MQAHLNANTHTDAVHALAATYHAGGDVGVSHCRSLAASLLSSEWLTCFSLRQQMVQPPLHYSRSLFLLICPRFSSLPTRLCLCLSSCLSLLLSACIAASRVVCLSVSGSVCVCVCVCVCVGLPILLAGGCLCYILDRVPQCFSLPVLPNRESFSAYANTSTYECVSLFCGTQSCDKTKDVICLCVHLTSFSKLTHTYTSFRCFSLLSRVLVAYFKLVLHIKREDDFNCGHPHTNEKCPLSLVCHSEYWFWLWIASFPSDMCA